MSGIADTDAGRLLAGVLAGGVGLLDEIDRVPAAAITDPTMRRVLVAAREYRRRTGGMITRDALLSTVPDAGSQALAGEVFDVLTSNNAQDAAGVRWYADQVVEAHKRHTLTRVMAEASDIASGSVTEEPGPSGRPGRTWSGVADAAEWLRLRAAEVEALGAPRRGAVGTRRMRATRATDVVARRQAWLWERRIVLGGLTLLAGREGLGKSTVAVDLAACVTRGTLLGEYHGTPRTVLYVATEDSLDYTVKPRLIAAGADLDRVIFPDVVTTTADGEAEAPIVLPTDVDALAEMVLAEDAALVVLDAATSTIDGKLDGDRDRQMRQGLEAIARGVGARTGAAVLGIVHFGKRESADTGKLILGSIAWSQVARSVLAVARDDETGDLVVTGTKANLAAPAPLVGGRVVVAEVDTADGPTSVSRIEWTGETDHDARDLLSGVRETAEARDERDEAVAFIRAVLADAPGGEMGAAEVISAAERAGIAKHNVQRARKRAGVTTRKRAMGSGWVWALDTQSDDEGDGVDPGAPEDDSRTPEDDEGDKVTCARASSSSSSSSVSSSGGSSPSVPSPPPPPDTQSDYGLGVETDPVTLAILAGSSLAPAGDAA